MLLFYIFKLLFNVFSDARVAAPLVKSATMHGEHGNIGNTFLYVFQHVTKYGYYPEVRKSKLKRLYVFKCLFILPSRMCFICRWSINICQYSYAKTNSLGTMNQLHRFNKTKRCFIRLCVFVLK